ncbi:hypothetical protein QAD02_021918 [Eretmocerus hayati]|uniref:Uncharacterized protein n=1 Tax=Eretmocerus hayati TaxID=131215 RepID=A0ACC2PR99_9HYME|nr:hypothetical protein QAD02_021918 [Eretmocerus hayati]
MVRLSKQPAIQHISHAKIAVCPLMHFSHARAGASQQKHRILSLKSLPFNSIPSSSKRSIPSRNFFKNVSIGSDLPVPLKLPITKGGLYLYSREYITVCIKQANTKLNPEIINFTIHSAAKLHQTGAQLWSLALITPLILGPFIDINDQYWLNYTTLLEITCIVAEYKISFETLGFSELGNEDYLESFQRLYNLKLIPKQHLLIHYIRLILKFGPLYLYNTLRPEAEHQFFKQAIEKTKNLKDPSKSLAMHHQISLIDCPGDDEDEDEGVRSRPTVLCKSLPYAHLVPASLEEITTVLWIENECDVKEGSPKNDTCASESMKSRDNVCEKLDATSAPMPTTHEPSQQVQPQNSGIAEVVLIDGVSITQEEFKDLSIVIEPEQLPTDPLDTGNQTASTDAADHVS